MRGGAGFLCGLLSDRIISLISREKKVAGSKKKKTPRNF